MRSKPISGKYGYLDDNGEIKVVEYTSRNGTGFQLLEDGKPVTTPTPPPSAPAPPSLPAPSPAIPAIRPEQLQVRI